MPTTDTIATEVELRGDTLFYGYVYVATDPASPRTGDTRVLFTERDTPGVIDLYNTRGYPNPTPGQVRAVADALRDGAHARGLRLYDES